MKKGNRCISKLKVSNSCAKFKKNLLFILLPKNTWEVFLHCYFLIGKWKKDFSELLFFFVFFIHISNKTKKSVKKNQSLIRTAGKVKYCIPNKFLFYTFRVDFLMQVLQQKCSIQEDSTKFPFVCHTFYSETNFFWWKIKDFSKQLTKKQFVFINLIFSLS